MSQQATPPGLSSEKIQGILELEKLKNQSEAVNVAFKERQLAADLELAKFQLDRHIPFTLSRQVADIWPGERPAHKKPEIDPDNRPPKFFNPTQP